ncbi:hypothetical protein [Levilactobacillus cerevisiae]|uniref:hypothetical protein n=1 Tax=Levilactobacillus cerevisiae TaxID=1704076 RepID=UPI000F7AFD7D|nr:hypothetical protein [Levilactobacillus cerevisiae]
MTKGLAFTFHGGSAAFLDRLPLVIDDLDEVDLKVLEQICNWSWTNDCVIPVGGLPVSADEVESRLNKLERLRLLDYGQRV